MEKFIEKIDNHLNNHFAITLLILIVLFLFLFPFILLFSPLILGYVIYEFIHEYFYFKSTKFKEIKESIQKYIDDCNDLNNHIEELKLSSNTISRKDFGNSILEDNSKYNFQRKELNNFNNNSYTYNCSLQICRKAQQQPFVYLFKYFNLEKNENTLSNFENMLNNFNSIEEGKNYLNNKKQEIFEKIKTKIPFFIKTFRKDKINKELGLPNINFKETYFPIYIFQYISPAGNASLNTKIILNIENLNKLVVYLSENIKWRKSIKGQRALMTSKLREKIKQRDSYTCQYCNNSINVEPNLLLEIDHKIPLSKGGITEEENLQTLCWRCNRTKSNKM